MRRARPANGRPLMRGAVTHTQRIERQLDPVFHIWQGAAGIQIAR
jgi:hypothetical protein